MRRDLSAFRALWTRVLPPAGPALDRVACWEELLVIEVSRVDCERWVDGRLVLVGDAAHAMAPNLGQGANSALVDAAVLAVELAADQPVDQALSRYAQRRRQPVRRVQDAPIGSPRPAACATRCSAGCATPLCAVWDGLRAGSTGRNDSCSRRTRPGPTRRCGRCWTEGRWLARLHQASNQNDA
jgi:hypothetical protein